MGQFGYKKCIQVAILLVKQMLLDVVANHLGKRRCLVVACHKYVAASCRCFGPVV